MTALETCRHYNCYERERKLCWLCACLLTVSSLLTLLDLEVEDTAISEQTAIISHHNINLLVFITETECVYCAVRTGALNVIQVVLHCSTLISTCMLLLPVGQTGEGWEPSKKQYCLAIRRTLDRKVP
jgi:hypothetical protein